MSNLEQAIQIATKAHLGQVDKSGQPYILHPLRLMLRVHTDAERIVAILHDVVEDSDISIEVLKTLGFSNEIINAINCLSKRSNEDYSDFIQRILENPLATKIKIEDIKDNLDITHLKEITEKDLNRIKKYHDALNLLKIQETSTC